MVPTRPPCRKGIISTFSYFGLYICWMNRLNDVYEYPAASARKQLMDAGHLQTVGGEPLVDLVRPGDKDLLGRRLHLPRGAQVQPGQATQLILTRSSTVCQ